MGVSVASVSVGDSKSMVVADNLTRTQIVMYAGASGDYNPLHSDEVFTTQVAGYPSVFAHGMLSMGATGRLLTDWFGVDGLDRFSVRFVNQVWPGDTLEATAIVTGLREVDGRMVADLSVTTANQHGADILVGSAIARLVG
jgi:acyl dehydratase